MTQKEALSILKMGHNVFITGAAGSGKTHLLNEYIKYLRDHEVEIGVTASTGIAATHIGGITIHAWSGLGIRDDISDYDLEDLAGRSYLRKRLLNAKVLIIDEISMLHDFRLGLVDKVLRYFRQSQKLFGGLQVVLCGDFFQLPPVSRPGFGPTLFAYHSPLWKNLDLKICYLEEQFRQSDPDYLKILNAVRSDKVSEDLLEKIRSRLNKNPEISVEPTKLYTHNVNVDNENEKELSKLPGEMHQYEMEGRGRGKLLELLKKSTLAPEFLKLKKNARVIFVKNNFEKGYVNGTLGTVADCDYFSIKVRTGQGVLIDVPKASWSINDNGKVLAEISQFPLRLAWAITVHKSQGMSMDAAEVDLSRSFEKGMGYVALSRIRTLSGLKLIGINDNALQVSEEVLNMDKNFRGLSARHSAEIFEMGIAVAKKVQEEFLEKVTSGEKRKKKKRDTVSETREFFLSGKTLSEIAHLRGLVFGTIVDHLEKIKKADPEFDFSGLSKEISLSNAKKIQNAFRRAGISDGEYRLLPAKAFLPDSISYDEMRLARLLMK